MKFSLAIFFLSAFLSSSYSMQNSKTHAYLAATENIYESTFGYEQQNGAKFRFNTLKGKVTLVYVWAYWCSQCAKKPEMLKELRQEINNPNFEIVFVTMDDNRAEWRKFISKNKWEGIHLMKPDNLDNPLARIIYQPKTVDGETVYMTYSSTFYLIDKNGNGKRIHKAETNKDLAYAIKKAL